MGVRFPPGAHFDSPLDKARGSLRVKLKMKKSVKREFSAGGAVYKREKDKILWLIIQPSAKDQPWRQGRWQLPKGWIDEGESGQQAAVREVKEEGGVEAEIIERVDRINIFFHDEHKQRVTKNIVFFLMAYKKGSENDHGEEIEEAVWLPYKEALERLTFKSEKEILKKAKELLKKRKEQLKLV